MGRLFDLMSGISYKQQAGDPAGFVAQFMSYMSNQETAHAYDFWAAVWCIGAACGRAVLVPRPRALVFGNWYVVLVADSGITRKSTAVRTATAVLRRVVGSDEAVWLEGRTTPEAMEIALHEHTRKHGDARAIISVSELVTFLGRDKYNVAMPGLLTDLYDSPDERIAGGTVGRGRLVMRDVHLSFLSASTPTWLASAINPDVVEGGFTSRCLFIHSEQRKGKFAWAMETSTDADKMDRLSRLLASTTQQATETGRFLLTDKAMQRFKRWYSARPAARDPYRQSFESREDAHVLRLAMCLAINDREEMIGHRHINRATRVIQHEKARAAQLFEGGITPDKLVLGVNKIIEVLIERGAGGVPQTYLFLKARHLIDAGSFNAALDIMHEMRMVDKYEDTRRGSGRKATIWRATKRINEMSARDDLIASLDH